MCLSASVNIDVENDSFHKVLHEQLGKSCYYHYIFSKSTSYILDLFSRQDVNSWTATEYLGFEKNTSFWGRKGQIWVFTGCSTGCSKHSSLEKSFLLLLTAQLFKRVFVGLNHSSIATRLSLCTKKNSSTLADSLIFKRLSVHHEIGSYSYMLFT